MLRDLGHSKYFNVQNSLKNLLLKADTDKKDFQPEIVAGKLRGLAVKMIQLNFF